jgi:C_GCAxxG_C_C family probable redox protein
MDSRKAQIAVDKLAEGYNCAQALAFAFSEECGLSPDLALKAACGFGGGMGRKQEVCGAVTGAILVLGLRQGRGAEESPSVTQDTYKSVREFMDAFAARNGSWICRDLLSGCDLMTEEGRRRVREEGLSKTICAECVRSAAQILEPML